MRNLQNSNSNWNLNPRESKYTCNRKIKCKKQTQLLLLPFLYLPHTHTREQASEFVALTHTDARTAFAVGFSAMVCVYRYLQVALLLLSLNF